MDRAISQNGFTLIEMLTVITITGILLAIAALGARSMIETYRVRGAARQVYSDMQMARLKAIKEGKEWRVEFSGATYCVKNKGSDNDWDAGCASGAGDEIVKTVDLAGEYSGVKVCDPNTAEFNPNGTASEGRATISKDTRVQKVYISSTGTGNVRIQNLTTPCP